MKTDSPIEYREAQDVAELKRLFELRYEVYKNDQSLKRMISTNYYDLNSFDLNALHYGGFKNGEAIAYIRLAINEKTHQSALVKAVLDDHGISLPKNEHLFPFQNYYPDFTWSNEFLGKLNGKKVGEVGRLAIHHSYRNGGQVLDDLFQAFIKYCRDEHQVNTGFGSCTLLLERYYRKFGFQRAENCQPFVYKNLPEAVIVRFDDVKAGN